MGERLKDKGAIVVGGGGGIGAEIALALAAEGAKVIVNDPGGARDGTGSDKTPADRTVDRIKEKGGTAVANYDSAADFNVAEGIIKSCIDNFGRLDILMNVAGINRERMVWNLTADDWDMVLKVHLYTTFNTCRWAAGIMRQQRSGRIINTTSTAWLGSMGQANYAAAKGAIVSFTRSIALQLGRYGVTCNALSPAAASRMTVGPEMLEPLVRRLGREEAERRQAETMQAMPPEHVPPIVVYLCTDEAADINGKVFHAVRGRVSIYSDPVEVRSIYNTGEIWSLEQLIDLVPKTLLVGYTNPMPAEKLEEKTS
ncbi:putative short-chain type dehydrogenase/reductase [subsurface metagenome]